MKPKQIGLVVASLLVVVLVALLGTQLHQALSSPPRFRATTLVLMQPFTNAVMTESFQAHAFHSMPGVHLKQTGAGLIEVVAYGPSKTTAETNAWEAFYCLARAGENAFGAGVRMYVCRAPIDGHRTSILHP
jgi:hypothetical protein